LTGRPRGGSLYHRRPPGHNTPEGVADIATRFLCAAIVVVSIAVLNSCAAPAIDPATTPDGEPTVSQLAGTQLHIVGDGVRLRAGPSRDHKIVGTLKRGDPVTVLFGRGAWCAVARDADTVWVHANLVGSLEEAQSR
jgi:uncharacterized protein YgiM (DUF1202 family)